MLSPFLSRFYIGKPWRMVLFLIAKMFPLPSPYPSDNYLNTALPSMIRFAQ